MSVWVNSIPVISFLALYLVTFLVAKWIYNLLTPYDCNEQLTQKDNQAVAVGFAGYIIGITIIFIGTAIGPTKGLQMDLITVGGYSLLGILCLKLAYFINDKLILNQFSNTKEVIEDKNVGTGVVQCGSYISSACIIAGAVNGEGGGIVTLLAFFGLGQLALILFAKVYEKLTPYSIHKQIEQDNVAAGVGFAGALVGLGIILMKASAGNFISWQHNLSKFGYYTCLAIVLLVIVRIFFDKLVLSKADLNKEIKQDKNTGAAILEAVSAICFASILFFLV